MLDKDVTGKIRDKNTTENRIFSEDIRVAGIVNDSITDGPGLRFTLFLQGCKMNCTRCHNPESLAVDGGELYTIRDIIKKLNKNPLLMGVTFSGGEPLLQAKALIPLAEKIKTARLDLAIYTGYVLEDLLDGSASVYEYSHKSDVMKLLALGDTLIDGPFIIEKKSLNLPFRGSTNQRILDIPLSLKQNQPIMKTDIAWTLE